MDCPKCKKKIVQKSGTRKGFYKGHPYRIPAFQCQGCGHQWREGRRRWL